MSTALDMTFPHLCLLFQNIFPGNTPILPPEELKAIGYTMAAYPLTLLSASIKAMQESLELIKKGKPTDDCILSFTETKDVVGFSQYADEEKRYITD